MANYISQITLPNNTTYTLKDRTLNIYSGSCATAAATEIKDVTCPELTTLTKGAVVFVTFTYTNTAAVGNLKLRVNSSVAADAKPIKHQYNASESNIPDKGYIRANQTYQFYYDGTNWVMVTDYNTNTNNAVTQSGNTDNKEYSILLKNTDNTTDETTGVKYGKTTDKLVTVNPSTGRITAPGGLEGKASTAGVADSANAVTWEHVNGKPSTYTPSSHTHGNITNDGKLQTTDITIENGDKLIVTDANDGNKIARTSINFDGTTITKALTQKGTWETFNNYIHPTSDGNLHVPATGTYSGGKFLKAGHTAGSISWENITAADVANIIRYYNNHDNNIDTLNTTLYLQTAELEGGNWSGTKPTGAHNGLALFNFHTHSGNYYSQLAIDTNQNRLWLRSANNATSYSAWAKVAYIDDIPTNLNQLTNGPGYVTSSGVTSLTIKTTSPITGGSDTAVTSTGTYTIGIDTSGTWNGNAVTATTASKLTNFQVSTTGSLGLEIATNSIGYVSGLTKAAWNYQQTDGAIYGQFYNASWKTEIFQDYRTGQLSVRGKNNGTWQAWRRILDETNGATILGLGSAAYTASTDYATSGHTHNYAGSASAGGSATTADKVIHSASGVSYISGAAGTNAAVYAKKATGLIWYPAVALQTSGGGAWQIGNYNDETLEFQYATKANIDSQTNTTSEIYMSAGDTGRVATSGNVGTGDNNGQIKIAGTNVSVKGLQALAYKASLVASDIPDISGTYLKLTGGKMTGRIYREGVSTNWNKGRDNALVALSKLDGYSPFASIKTNNGSWDIGSYNNTSYTDDLIFSYVPDSMYNGTNSTPTQIKFLENGHIVGALDGNATTSTSWANARKVYVALGTVSTTTTINGGAADAAAIGIGVDGTLGIAHGGTGATTAQAAIVNLFTNSTVSEASGDFTDSTIMITSNNSGSTADWYRRSGVKIWNYIKGKADSVYASQTTVNGLLAAADAMIFKGTIGTNGTVTGLPATHNAGWTYRVITANTYPIVDSNGKYCEVGTLIICIADGTAANAAHWTAVETNEDGSVIGPASVTATGNIAVFSGTSGRIITDSGTTIANASVKYATSAGKATNDGDGNAINTTYLKKSGGEMNGTAVISWANSGSWGSSSATFPLKRGGLYWVGTSDWIDLFAEETSSDNFNLIINFGDDASPSLILRDRGTDKITMKPSSGTITATTFSGALNGNATSASSAATLTTSRTLWGQSFNGSANVTGNMTNVGPSFTLPSGNTTFSFYNSSSNPAIGRFGRLGLSTDFSKIDTSNCILHVNGSTQVADMIYRTSAASNENPMLYLNAAGKDAWLWQVSNGTTNHMYYGYGLKYLSSGQDALKYLELIADNSNGTEVIALAVDQFGHIGIGGLPTNQYNLTITGGTNFNGIFKADGLGIGIDADDPSTVTSDYHIAKFNGSILITTGTTTKTSVAHSDVVMVSNNPTLDFYPHVSTRGNIGKSSYRWANGYFSNSVSLSTTVSNVATSITLNATGTATLVAANPQITFTPNSGSSWAIKNAAGTLQIGNNSGMLSGSGVNFAITSRLFVNTTIPTSPTTNFYVTGTSQLQGAVGINTAAEAISGTGTDEHILKINGSTLIVIGTNSVAHLDVVTESSTNLLKFTPAANNQGQIGTDTLRWKYVYAGTEINVKNSNTGFVATSAGAVTISAASPSIALTSTTTNALGWTISNANGTYTVSNGTYSFTGEANGFKANRLYINYSSALSSNLVDFYVNGSSHITTALGIGIAPDTTHKLLVSGSTKLDGNVGIGAAASTGTNAHKLYVKGTSKFDGASYYTNALYFANGTTYYVDASANAKFANLELTGTLTMSNVTINNAAITGNFLPSAHNTYTLGSSSKTWSAVYIGSSASYGATNKPIYWNNGVPTAISGNIGSSSQPIYISGGVLTASTGTVGSNVQPIYMSGGTLTATTQTVGSGTKPIFLSGGSLTASSSSVGNAYTPVYLNSGTLTAVTLVQKIEWSMDNTHKSVKITHNSDNTAFAANSIVIGIVVTSGESYLTAPITWKSGDNYIALNTSTAVTGTVSGYVLVVRGTEVAATNITLTKSTSTV